MLQKGMEMDKLYWTLICREKDGKWYPQFGGYTRKEVAAEEQSAYARDYKPLDRQIICTNEDQAAINRHIEMVNAQWGHR